MFKRLVSLFLCMAAVLALPSCSWWFETPDDADSKLDTDVPNDAAEQNDTTDTVSDTADTEALTDETGIPSIDSSALQELGENLQFFHTPNDDCVIVYNHENAWAFDYTLNKITRLSDFDAMYAVADITERGKEFFENATLDVECEMVQEYEVRITHTVKSSIADAFYKVYSYYTLDNHPLYDRGETRGYFYEDIEYPGDDEPMVIYDVDNLEILTKNNAVMEDYYSRVIRALVELDIPELEKITGAAEGLLSEWENVVISDYSIANEYPSNPYNNALLVTINITESTIERYPAGEHKIRVAEGIGPVFSPVSPDFDESILSGAEEFVYTWASRFGGAYPIERQIMTDGGYSHEIIDFYLNREGDNPTFEGFKEFCGKSFGYTLEGSGIDRTSVEQHGGHGGSGVLCEITSVVSAGNNYSIEITFYADELKSVVSKIYRYHVSDHMDGTYKINSCESVYDAGLRIEGWSA